MTIANHLNVRTDYAPAKEKAAPGRTGTASITALSTVNSINKIDRIRIELTRPEGLNRFEAERLGDHCLNSTVAAIRRHGVSVWGEWETVPTKYSPKGVRVMRYWAEELKV